LTLYYLQGPKTPDWGDYGDVLVSGWATRSDQTGLLELERTGPFVPPVFLTLEGVIVTDAFRRLLETSDLTGFTFQPIQKKRIVLLHWEKWDQTADEPEFYPESGESEDYILQNPNNPRAAEKMGTLWEVSVGEHADLIPFQGLAYWDGTDWFRARGIHNVYVSERTRKWLQSNAGDWVSFKEAILATSS
jgi:hypothetical protein